MSASYAMSAVLPDSAGAADVRVRRRRDRGGVAALPRAAERARRSDLVRKIFNALSVRTNK